MVIHYEEALYQVYGPLPYLLPLPTTVRAILQTRELPDRTTCVVGNCIISTFNKFKCIHHRSYSLSDMTFTTLPAFGAAVTMCLYDSFVAQSFPQVKSIRIQMKKISPVGD